MASIARITPLLAVLVAALAAAATAQPRASATNGPPLRTAVMDPALASPADFGVAASRIRAAGATAVRLNVDWGAIAPGAARSASFDATDPEDPTYRFAPLDALVKRAAAAGLEPILSVFGAPAWATTGRKKRAQDGPTQPSPKAYGDFATALSRRYSGNVDGLPRVRWFQAWNEPNVSLFLMPQFSGGAPYSPVWYRRLVNAFSDAVHSVHPDNLSIAGGLSPFTVRNLAVQTVAPLTFMRKLLCLSAAKVPRATCHERVRFDVWAQHPYTSGGPTHQAANPNDVSLGDLAKIRPVLTAARSAGNLVSRSPAQFWVTEFSWDTKPPDPHGVPLALHARWTAEALYRMWSAGVSLVTWFTLRDQPLATSDFQSGLYFRGPTLARDRAKPSLLAFRFPFVAYRAPGAVQAWGRTPTSAPGRVLIERSSGRGWASIGALTADRTGSSVAACGRPRRRAPCARASPARSRGRSRSPCRPTTP